MSEVKVLILRAAGINCDFETQDAFELAGASVDRMHINKVIGEPGVLRDYQILVFPGGFSYGDDVSAGKILANQVVHHLADVVREFIAAGKLVLGICNGFQVLVKSGILPGFEQGRGLTVSPEVTITSNDNGKFEDRWVYLEPGSSRCVFIDQGRRIYLPIAHGEGKFVGINDGIVERIREGGYAAFRYVDAEGNRGGFPINPNGSVDDIAGLTDSTGRVLGLMPHPERHIHRWQHPHWTRLEGDGEASGMSIFRNAVDYVMSNFYS
jgi:phosphoribosylformylglycinamidine synthase